MRLILAITLAACHPASDEVGDLRHPPGDTDPADTDPADTDSVDTPPDTDGDTGAGANPQGVDVSHWDGDIDWDRVADDDIQFAYVKATQGTTFRDPKFADMYDGARDAGLIRGSYHFAEPDSSDGASQADFFVDNGGDWAPDGYTLPGALDIEWNPDPDGTDCYGLSKSEMAFWIHDFVDEYEGLTGRTPAIYCGQTWWGECVGSGDYSASPLWVASWDDPAPNLPLGWTDHDIWQYGATTVDGIDVDSDINVFNGSHARLRHLADDLE